MAIRGHRETDATRKRSHALNYFTNPKQVKPPKLKQVWVSENFHSWLKAISQKSGQPMYVLTDQLMDLAEQQPKETAHAD